MCVRKPLRLSITFDIFHSSVLAVNPKLVNSGGVSPTPIEDYEFDLRGFVVVRGALSADEVAALNDAYDRFPALSNGEWYGNAQRRDYTADTGFELHNVLDCGDPAFDVLIDHPSWIGHVRHWAGEEGTYVQGIMIDEAIATIRESGGHHPVHSGGHDASIRTQFGYRNGRFRCGQVNCLVALRDIGPGDGPTMIVPGSHKQHLSHPGIATTRRATAWTTWRGPSPCTPRPAMRCSSSTHACTAVRAAPTPANGA